ncbi:Imm52 family immunity protein [Micromonospora sp. NPDC005171]|uniref:Imm52 family immunity protein n=1 Tax=Micromonospora sp. NPDC005171 TaxID=3156866 RepID=UPI0033BF934A
MLAEKVLFQVVWGARQETADQIAHRWWRLNQRLGTVDPLLSRWVILEEHDEGYLELNLDRQTLLKQVVIEGANENKPDLGFGFGAWNGQSGELEVSFRAQAGQSQSASGLVNSARIEVRPQSEDEVHRWTAAARSVLMSLVEAFDPDFGMVWTHPVRQAQQVAPAHPFAGFITYLSGMRGSSVPAELRPEVQEQGGVLLSLVVPGEGWPGVEEVARLGSALKQAGSLEPAV